MAQLKANISTAMYNIKKFRGLNEAEGGDTTLKDGEASVMRNFRITDSGALTPRPTLKVLKPLTSTGKEYYSDGAIDYSIPDRSPSSDKALSFYTAYVVRNGKVEVDGTPLTSIYNSMSAKDRNNAEDLIIEYFTHSGAALFCTVDGVVYFLDQPLAGGDTLSLYRLVPSGGVTALWSGCVNGQRELFAVANRCLWWTTNLNGQDDSLSCIQIPGVHFDGGAHIFGFAGKLYILTGKDYLCWDGSKVSSVEGYIPCVLTACTPANGSGTAYERVNNLTLKRKCRYNADGEATTYKILEQGVTVLEVRVNGELKAAGSDYTKSTSKVVFSEAPAQGVENVEIVYTLPGNSLQTKDFTTAGYYITAFAFAPKDYGMELEELNVYILAGEAETPELVDPSQYTVISNHIVLFRKKLLAGEKVRVKYKFRTPREQILAMKYSELYNGANENRVFLYGDGTNRTIYSGLDENGQPTAEYFPDLNECRVGNDISPITAMIKHYNRLLVFKDNEAYSIYSNLVSLANGSVTAGFYVSSINKAIGSCAEGQAVLVENRVRTLDGLDIYEWRATSTSGNITLDQRNASRVSQRVYETLSKFDLSKSILFYDKERHEFYCICDGKAVVQNIEVDAWYLYTDFPVTCMTVFDNKLFCGLNNGYIAILDRNEEVDFETEWASGSLDFGRPFAYKLSTQIWTQICPENARSLNISVETENGSKLEKCVTTSPIGAVKHTLTVKLKPQKFIRYKLGFEAKNRLTILGANIAVSYSNNVK